MAEEKERTQRRVYVLPNELVDRISAFQADMGLQSEVEAARRLLDEALKHRDDWLAITRRFQQRMRETKILSDIAKDVLVGHPRVDSMKFGNDSISFSTTSGDHVTIFSDGRATARDRHQNTINLDSMGNDTDEIPF